MAIAVVGSACGRTETSAPSAQQTAPVVATDAEQQGTSEKPSREDSNAAEVAPEQQGTSEKPSREDSNALDDVATTTLTSKPESQNKAPTAGVLGSQVVVAGKTAAVDLSSFFEDADGDELTFAVVSSAGDVVAVSVSGSELTIAGESEGIATVTVAARDPGGLSVEQSLEVTVRPYVVSLEVAGTTAWTALGERRRLTVTAGYSDGSRAEVDGALVEWRSSDPAVAEVLSGDLTGVGAGNATITATFGESSAEVPVHIATHRIGTPPAALGLDPFYAKSLDAEGILVVSSGQVADEALWQAGRIIDEMLTNRRDVQATLATHNARVAIMAEDSGLTEVPEFSDYVKYWDDTKKMNRALAMSLDIPFVAIGEEHLLCYETDLYPYSDIFVHEMAHLVHLGINLGQEGSQFNRRLEGAYSAAVDAGLWKNTYAATHPTEFWAMGVQSWFDLHGPLGPGGGDIDTRGKLEDYDSALAALIEGVFGRVSISSSCHIAASTTDH